MTTTPREPSPAAGQRAGFWADLLPTWVSYAHMDPRRGDPATLLPEEFRCVARAIERRQREFAAGRHLAKQLLGPLGAPTRVPLLPGPGGAPRWPLGVVGSISHSRNMVVVAVSRAAPGRLLGVDVELDTPLPEALFRRVCVERELQWMASAFPRHRGHWAKLFFSAKESVFKAAYPRSGQMLEFSDAWVRFDPDRREFEARVVNGSWPDGADWGFRGRYHRGGGAVATAVIGTTAAS